MWVRKILQDSALSQHLKTVEKVADDTEKANSKPEDLKVVDDDTGASEKTNTSTDGVEKAVKTPAASGPDVDAPTSAIRP